MPLTWLNQSWVAKKNQSWVAKKGKRLKKWTEASRGLSEKLVLSKIIAEKGLSEREFQGFKSNRQRNVVPVIFSNDSWTEFSYIIIIIIIIIIIVIILIIIIIIIIILHL